MRVVIDISEMAETLGWGTDEVLYFLLGPNLEIKGSAHDWAVAVNTDDKPHRSATPILMKMGARQYFVKRESDLALGQGRRRAIDGGPPSYY